MLTVAAIFAAAAEAGRPFEGCSFFRGIHVMVISEKRNACKMKIQNEVSSYIY